MHSIVKEAFFLIMMVTIAAMMYFILFGSFDDRAFIYEGRDAGVVTVTDGGVTSTRWEGVLWYAARQVENPIAFYYYNYCLLPNAHKNDYLDLELGCKVYGKTNINNVTMADYRNQSTSIISPSSYLTYPGDYSAGTVTSIPDFGGSNHYHYRDSESDF